MANNLMSFFQKGFDDGHQNYNDIHNKSVARAAAQLGLNELHDAYLIKSNLIPERHLQAKTKIEADTIDDLYRAKSTVATMPYKDALTVSHAQNAMGQHALEGDVRRHTWDLQLGAAQAQQQANMAQNQWNAYKAADDLTMAQASQAPRRAAALSNANAASRLAGVGEIGADANYRTVLNNPNAVQAISDNTLSATHRQSQTDVAQANAGFSDAQVQAAARMINMQIAPMSDSQQEVHLGRILLSGVYNEQQKQAAAQILAQRREQQEQAKVALLKATNGKEMKSPEQLASERVRLAQIELYPEQVAAQMGISVQPKAGGGYILQYPGFPVPVKDDSGNVVGEQWRKGVVQEVGSLFELKAVLERASGLSGTANEKIEQYANRPQDNLMQLFGVGGLNGAVMYGGGDGGSR